MTSTVTAALWLGGGKGKEGRGGEGREGEGREGEGREGEGREGEGREGGDKRRVEGEGEIDLAFFFCCRSRVAASVHASNLYKFDE